MLPVPLPLMLVHDTTSPVVCVCFDFYRPVLCAAAHRCMQSTCVATDCGEPGCASTLPTQHVLPPTWQSWHRRLRHAAQAPPVERDEHSNLYVSGLSTNLTQQELCDFVKSINCGDYESLWRQQNKRFAFIRYGTPDKALDAMQRLQAYREHTSER